MKNPFLLLKEMKKLMDYAEEKKQLCTKCNGTGKIKSKKMQKYFLEYAYSIKEVRNIKKPEYIETILPYIDGAYMTCDCQLIEKVERKQGEDLLDFVARREKLSIERVKKKYYEIYQFINEKMPIEARTDNLDITDFINVQLVTSYIMAYNVYLYLRLMEEDVEIYSKPAFHFKKYNIYIVKKSDISKIRIISSHYSQYNFLVADKDNINVVENYKEPL